MYSVEMKYKVFMDGQKCDVFMMLIWSGGTCSCFQLIISLELLYESINVIGDSDPVTLL